MARRCTQYIHDLNIHCNALCNLPVVPENPVGSLSVTLCPAVQVHLTYVSDTSIIVPWATGASNSTAGPLSRNVLSKATVPASNVMYGTAAGIYTSTASANPSSNTLYTQIYNFSNANPALNYSSPIFHHVTLSNLSASTTYYYKVGDAMYGMSQEFNFTSAPKVQAIPLSWG